MQPLDCSRTERRECVMSATTQVAAQSDHATKASTPRIVIVRT